MINQMSQVGELNECYFNMQHQIISSMMQNIQELNDKITTAADEEGIVSDDEQRVACETDHENWFAATMDKLSTCATKIRRPGAQAQQVLPEQQNVIKSFTDAITNLSSVSIKVKLSQPFFNPTTSTKD